MEIVLYVIVAVVQFTAHGVGRVEVGGSLKIVVPEDHHNADHFQ